MTTKTTIHYKIKHNSGRFWNLRAIQSGVGRIWAKPGTAFAELQHARTAASQIPMLSRSNGEPTAASEFIIVRVETTETETPI